MGKLRWGWVLAALVWGACGGVPEDADDAPGGSAPELGTQVQAAHASALDTRWVSLTEGVELGEVAYDASGNLYVTLHYLGAQTLAGVALPWNGTPFDIHVGVAKFRPDHSLAWARGWSTARPETSGTSLSVRGFAVTRGGGVYVGGEAPEEGLRIGARTLAQGTFLLSLDGEGRVRWARTVEPQANARLFFHSFAAHPDGSLYALASFVSHTDARRSGLSLIRYGSDGKVRWGNVYEQPAGSTVFPSQVAADERGNAYVVGRAEGEVSFVGPVHRGGPTLFAFSTNGAGRPRWTRYFQVGEDSFVQDVVARGNRVVVAAYGDLHRALLLGLTTGGGAERWRRQVGSLWDPSMRLATSARNEVVLLAGTGDAGAFGLPPTARPEFNAFVARVRRSDGALGSARNFVLQRERQSGELFVRGVAVDGKGIVAVSGDFRNGSVDFGTGLLRTESAAFLLRAWP
jgi:hypothetical protein